MALCDGDVNQYAAIKYGSVDVFVIKLINFAHKVEAQSGGQSSAMPFG